MAEICGEPAPQLGAIGVIRVTFLDGIWAEIGRTRQAKSGDPARLLCRFCQTLRTETLRIYARAIPGNVDTRMPDFLKRNRSNPWLEKDRQDQRRIILTAVILVLAVLGGIGLLLHALMNG